MKIDLGQIPFLDDPSLRKKGETRGWALVKFDRAAGPDGKHAIKAAVPITSKDVDDYFSAARVAADASMG